MFKFDVKSQLEENLEFSMILQNQNLGQSPNRYHVKPFMQFRYLCFKVLVLVLIFLDDKALKR